MAEECSHPAAKFPKDRDKKQEKAQVLVSPVQAYLRPSSMTRRSVLSSVSAV